MKNDGSAGMVYNDQIAIPATGRTVPLNRHQVKQALLDRIVALEVGAKLPPERMLAEEFGVCRSTMTRVLADLAVEGYVSRKIGVGSFVLPRNQMMKSSPASRRVRGEVIIVYPDFFSFDIWSKVHCAEIAAMRSNRLLLNLKMQPDSDYELLFELVRECRKLEGIILASCTSFTPNVIRRLDEIGVPVVVAGEIEDIDSYRNIFCIRRNHVQSGFLKMDAVIAAGHRHIGIIPNELPTTIASRSCLRGMKDAVRRRKMRWSDIARPVKIMENWGSSMKCAYDQTLEVMRNHPEVTALVVDTASGAAGALRALADLKLRCPEDVSIVTAFSDTVQAEFTCPRLTAVSGSTAEVMIDAAMKIIFTPGEIGSRVMLLDVELTERESLRRL